MTVDGLKDPSYVPTTGEETESCVLQVSPHAAHECVVLLRDGGTSDRIMMLASRKVGWH